MLWNHDPIMHPLTLTARFNQTSTPEVSEMTRNRWLGQVEDFNKVADTDFSVSHQVHKAKASSVRQRLKQSLHDGGCALICHEHMLAYRFALTNMIPGRYIRTRECE